MAGTWSMSTHGRTGARYQAMRSPAGTLPCAPLFNADQYQAYSSAAVQRVSAALSSMSASPHGTVGGIAISPRGTRSWCYRCTRPNDLTDPLRHRSQRPRSYWMLATLLVCLACASRRIARELGMHVRTSDRWCWWLYKAAWSSASHRRLEGTVEAEDLSHTAGNKGHAKRGGKKVLGRCVRGRCTKREPGRGHDDTDWPARIAWVSRQGAVVPQATRDCTVKTGQKAADSAVQAGSRLSTDAASSSRACRALSTRASITPRKRSPG